MALLKTITYSTEQGFDFEINSYIRVDSVNSKKDFAITSVHQYKDKESFDNGKQPINITVVKFIPSVDDGSENIIKQAYDHLKTLDEFSGATDA